ncbi:indole-3-glycerol phosphate synthase TrpC [Lyngbya sp. PCC 8106]|uniref:indole-3-glycerol phosphate synthase TrpC n=1 Tax=Lyngbya sp. (strain PCC 8106) TaxID=313612 RepID=UPI0000EAD498|nr:indole-3-glycerol phosphate synthase TrpC [Lyngbya sp. PCC 8106]EAW33589.1 indole-3-glycerol-phosphate synthase [Lyngbya sp. PCC 8106]
MQIRRRRPNPSVNVASLLYTVAVPDDQPQNILEEIVWEKEKEVDRRRESLPLLQLRSQLENLSPAKDFLAALKASPTQPAIIAEVKKASPSKGVIREDFDPVKIAQAYQENGACCLSVLTDEKFFQGSFENLGKIRAAVEIPLLCKEFVIYPYQIYQARIYGADAILLIAAILSKQDLQYFVKIVKTLGMTPLIEVHTLEELEQVLCLQGVSLIGINNRNLEDFSVDLDTTRQLLDAKKEQIQSQDILVVSESGLYTQDDLNFVKNAGANAVLIGESLIKQPDPGKALQQLIGRD